MLHPLSQIKRNLISSEPWICEAFNSHYGLLEKLFKEISTEINGIKGRSDHLKPEFAKKEMAKDIQKYRERLKIVNEQQYKTTANALKSNQEQIDTQRTPKKPETEIGQLMRFLKESEIRRQFEGLAKDVKRTVLTESVKLGDRTILSALENSLSPIVSENALNMARSTYEGVTVDRGLIQSAEMNSKLLDSLQRTSLATERHLDDICAKNGIPTTTDIKILTAAENKSAKMTSSEKASFISKHGLENFKQVVDGRAAISEFEPEAAPMA